MFFSVVEKSETQPDEISIVWKFRACLLKIVFADGKVQHLREILSKFPNCVPYFQIHYTFVVCKAVLKFYITVTSHAFKHLKRVDQQLNVFLYSAEYLKMHCLFPKHMNVQDKIFHLPSPPLMSIFKSIIL